MSRPPLVIHLIFHGIITGHRGFESLENRGNKIHCRFFKDVYTDEFNPTASLPGQFIRCMEVLHAPALARKPFDRQEILYYSDR